MENFPKVAAALFLPLSFLLSRPFKGRVCGIPFVRNAWKKRHVKQREVDEGGGGKSFTGKHVGRSGCALFDVSFERQTCRKFEAIRPNATKFAGMLAG